MNFHATRQSKSSSYYHTITHIFFYSHRMTLWIKCFDLYFHSFCHRRVFLRHSAWTTAAFMICLHCLTNSILACQLKWSVHNSCYLYLNMTISKCYNYRQHELAKFLGCNHRGINYKKQIFFIYNERENPKQTDRPQCNHLPYMGRFSI